MSQGASQRYENNPLTFIALCVRPLRLSAVNYTKEATAV